MIASSRLSLSRVSFGFKIDFAKGTEDPARVFRSLSEFTKFCQSLDKSLVRSLNIDAEPILILDDIEQGSIISWLKNNFKSSDKERFRVDILDEINIYLNKARRAFINFLSERDTIGNLAEATKLQTELLSLAQNSGIGKFTICGPVNHKELLESAENYQLALCELTLADKAYYLTANESFPINVNFRFSKDKIEDILLDRTLEAEREMILKIKKPDYLGDSKWVFRHGRKTIEAKVNDLEWMRSFRRREVPVIPGDSFRAIVKTVTKYDFNGEVLSEQSTIQKVIEVIPDIYEQISLF